MLAIIQNRDKSINDVLKNIKILAYFIKRMSEYIKIKDDMRK